MTGLGFNSPNISATIDGVPCQVNYYDRTRFTCITGPQPSPSTGPFFVGQHGLKRKYFNTTYSLNFGLLDTSPDFVSSLYPDLETI